MASAAMLPELVAVITGDQYQGVVLQSMLFQLRQHLTEIFVVEGDLILVQGVNALPLPIGLRDYRAGENGAKNPV